MTSVSLLNKTPVNEDVPFAIAAIINARLVMLFEPGGRIVPDTGPFVGVISHDSIMQVRSVFRDECHCEKLAS